MMTTNFYSGMTNPIWRMATSDKLSIIERAAVIGGLSSSLWAGIIYLLTL